MRFANPVEIAAVLAFAIAGVLSGSLHAQTNWTGSNSQDFNVAGNWSNGFPNVNGEQAFINTSTGNFPIYNDADGTTTTGWDVIVGSSAGAGLLNVTGGTLETTQNGNFLIIGEGGVGGPAGTLNVTGDGSIQTMRLNVGGSEFYSPGTGTATINTSGTITAIGTFQNIGIDIGVQAGSVGTVNFQNGTITSQGQIFVGDIGSGSMVQTSGTLSEAGYFVVGASTAGSSGTYTLSGGLVQAATGFGFTTIGSSGGTTAVLNVSGGTFDTSTGGMILGEDFNNAGATSATLNISGSGFVNLGANNFVTMAADQAVVTAVINLNGGTLATAGVKQGAGTGTFNFNGGTLLATTSTSAYMQGLSTANVQAGGAIINTSGFNDTIAQALLGTTNDGGLTKLGAGTLTLAGAETYTGNTTVSAGGLVVSGSLTGSSTTVAGGATFGLLNGGKYTFTITGASGVNNGVTGINGSGGVSLDGSFVFNLASAGTAAGDVWNIVNASSLASDVYGPDFTIGNSGATNNGGIWTFLNNGTAYQYNETVGTLSVVPEPASIWLSILGGAGLLVGFQRRRLLL